jgi:hypothetical protein
MKKIIPKPFTLLPFRLLFRLYAIDYQSSLGNSYLLR